MADNENLNTEAIEPVEVVHGLDVSKSLLGATLGATATEEDQEPDEEFETIPVKELVEVKLGRQGENDTQTVVIDCSAWLEKLPGCTLMIAATRPGEREIYLPEVTVDSGVVTWPIMEQDTACAGTGRAEVRAMKDGKIKKSALFRTRVEPALEGDGSPDAPTPPNWVKLIIGSVETSQAAAQHAEDLIEEATACAINAVRFDEAQTLTEEQKATGRGNIDAAGTGGMVSRYSGRRVSLIGDSISTCNGYLLPNYRPSLYPAPEKGVNSVEYTWWMKVIRASGSALEVNASHGSSRVTNTQPDGYPDFYARCGILGNPDVVFIELGTNDSITNIALGDYDFETNYLNLSEATFRTAYIKGCKALQANYPAAQIVPLIFPMKDAYADSIRHIADTLGLNVIDVRSYRLYNGDIHPGIEGMCDIASMVLNPTDATLGQSGVGADAAAVGAALESTAAALETIENKTVEAMEDKVDKQQGNGNAGKALIVGADGRVTTGDAGIPEAVKVALLQCFRKVAWIDATAQEYYDALYAALYSGVGPVVTKREWIYHFDNSLRSSGNMDLELTATAPIYAAGKIGNCLYSHDGDADQAAFNNNVNRSNMPDFDGDFTIAFWANLDNSGENTECNGIALADNLTVSRPGTIPQNLAELNPVAYIDDTSFPFWLSNTSHKLNVAGVAITFIASNDRNYYRPYVILVPDTLDKFYAVGMETANGGDKKIAQKGTWHHYALCRKDGIITLFYDGSRIWSVEFDKPIYRSSGAYVMGYDANGDGSVSINNNARHKIDELYINDEECLYTQNFTPPTTPYSAG